MKFEEDFDESKMKVYYFFHECAFIASYDCDCEKEALKEFLKEYTPTDYTFVLEVNKKNGEPFIFKNFNLLKKVKKLRHRR